MSVKVQQVRRRRRLRRPVAAAPAAPAAPVTAPVTAPVLVVPPTPRRSRSWILVDVLLAAAATVAVVSVTTEYRETQGERDADRHPPAIAQAD